MNRRVLKNVSTLVLFCFLLTPLYGLFQVEASTSPNRDITNSDNSTYSLFVIDGMDVEVSSPSVRSKVRSADIETDTESGGISLVNVTTYIGDKTGSPVTDYILEFRNINTGDKFVFNGESSEEFSLPYGVYTCYPIKIPAGAAYGRSDEIGSEITINNSNTTITVVFTSNNDVMDCYILTKAKNSSGGYDTIVPGCSYKLSNVSGSSEEFLTDIHAGKSGIGYAKLNPSSYKVTITDFPKNYVISTDIEALASVFDKKFVFIFYLDPKESVNEYSVTYEVKAGTSGSEASVGVGSLVKFKPQGGFGTVKEYVTDGYGKVYAVLPEDIYTVEVSLPYNKTLTGDASTVISNQLVVDKNTEASCLFEGTLSEAITSPTNKITINTTSNSTNINESVIVREYGSGDFICSVTTSDGVLEITDLPLGSYTVELYSSEYLSENLVYIVDNSTTEVECNIVSTQTFALPVRNIIVSVEDDKDGTKVTDAVISITDEDGATITASTSEKYGVFNRAVYPNKTYNVSLVSLPDGYAEKTFTKEVGKSLACSLVDIPVTYTMEREYPVNLVVVNQEDLPFADVNLRFTKQGGTGDAITKEVKSSSDGKLTLNLVEGTYLVELISADDNADANMENITYEHRYNNSVSKIVVNDEKYYSVTFEVLDKDNSPVANIPVEMQGVVDVKRTNDEGIVVYKVPAGSYTYTVTDDSGKYNMFVCPNPLDCTGDTNPDKITINLEDKNTFPVSLKAVGAGSAPKEKVTVKLTLKNSDISYVGTSDTEGNFDLEIPAGEYTVELVEVEGEPGAYADNIVYNHDKTGMPVLFSVQEQRLYNIKFKLLKPDGSPAYGESIVLKGKQTYTQSTDRNGEITFQVPTGAYMYSYSHPMDQYESITSEVPIIAEGDSDPEVITLNLRIINYTSVDIKVVDEYANSVKGMKFVVYKDGSDVYHTMFTTNDYGEGHLDLTKGSYVLKNTVIPDGYNGAEDVSFTLEGTETDKDINISIKSIRAENKTAKIKIKVVDKNDNPRSGVTLGFFKQPSQRTVTMIPDYSEETDSNGEVSLNVAEGTYNISILRAPLGFDYDTSYMKNFTVTGGENKNVGIIKEGESDIDTPPIVDLTDKGNLVITSLYNGDILEGVGFSLTNEKNEVTRHTTIDDDLVIEKAVGTYTLTVTSVPDGYSIKGSASTTVVVNKDINTSVQLNLNKLSDIDRPNPDDPNDPDNPDNPGIDKPGDKTKGNLLVNSIFNGYNVAGIGFSIHDADGNFIAQGVTDNSGLLRFTNLTPGSYTLYNVTVTDGYNLMNSRRVVVSPNQTTEIKVALSLRDNQQPTVDPDSNYGVFCVRARDYQGNPIPDAEFTLYSFDEEIDTAKTDSTGIAVFNDVAPGVYYYVWTGVGNSNSRTLERKAVTISKGEVASVNVAAPKERSREVSGVVFEDVNGNGIYESKYDSLYKGAKVQLLNEAGEKLLEVKTDEDGEYRFRYVPNGDYTLKLVKVRGYNYIDKRYGTYTDSSSIDKRGEVDIYIEGEDEDDIMMGIISEEIVINPILGNGADNNVKKSDGRFPTLETNSNEGLQNTNSNLDDVFLVSYENKDGLYVTDSPAPSVNDSANGNMGDTNGENKFSDLPDTGSVEFIEVAVLYILFMFVVMYTFRRFIFDKLVK